MDRALALKAKALARGTRRLPRLELDNLDRAADEVIDADLDVPSDDVIDADFVDVPDPTALVALVPRVSPGRIRRATDAYTAAPVDSRPVIAIG